MKTVFNVLEYGASGDGCTMNSAAIAKAVAAVKAAGGGELYFPAGTYLSGTISVVDNLTIHLAPGTTLLASGDFSDYVIARPGQYQSCEFISSCDVENFTIYGAFCVKRTEPRINTLYRRIFQVFLLSGLTNVCY